MPSGIKPSPETDARMIALYQSGMSEAKIAATVRLTPSGVHGALNRLGVIRHGSLANGLSPNVFENRKSTR